MNLYAVQFLDKKTWKEVFNFTRQPGPDWEALVEAEDLIVKYRDSILEKDKEIKNILDTFKLRLIKYHEDVDITGKLFSIIESWD